MKNSLTFFEFVTRIVVAKRLELELKAMDEKKMNRTIGDLCDELPSNDLWLTCTHGKIRKLLQFVDNETSVCQIFLILVVLRAEYELRNILKHAVSETRIDYRPRPG